MKHVYCIEAFDDRPLAYKIGVAANVESRIASMQTSNHAMLRSVTQFPCYSETAVESFLHSVLSMYRLRGEWFKPDPDVLRCCLRCSEVFSSLSESQNQMLCGALQDDGWLYRQVKGFDYSQMPSWLRLA